MQGSTEAQSGNVREINQSKVMVVETCSKADAKATAREWVDFNAGSVEIVRAPSEAAPHQWTVQVWER